MSPFSSIDTQRHQLNSLAQQGDANACRALIDAMATLTIKDHTVYIAACVRAAKNTNDAIQLGKAIDYLRALPAKGLPPSDFAYNTVLNGLCALGKMNEAVRLFKEMRANGPLPTSISYTILLKGYCRLGKIARAENILALMKRHRIALTDYPYTHLANVYCEKGQVDKAEALIEQMLQDNVTPKTYFFVAVIKARIKAHNFEKALSLLALMQKMGITPDVHIYGVLIKGYCDNKQPKKAQELLKEMKERRIERNEFVYNPLISAYFRLGNCEGAEAMYRLMKADHIQPSGISLTIMRAGFLRAGMPEKIACYEQEHIRYAFVQAEESLHVELEELVGKGKLIQARAKLRTITHKSCTLFDILLSAYCAKNRWQKAHELFSEMKMLSLDVTISSYRIMIEGAAKCDMGDVALGYYEEMKNIGLIPDSAIVSALMRVYFTAGAYEKVQQLFCEMSKVTLSPEAIHYAYMSRALCCENKIDQAVKLIRAMPEKITTPDPYNPVLEYYCNSDNLLKAEELFKRMCRKGVRPSLQTFNVMLKGCLDQNQCEKAQGYLEQMAHLAIEPSIETYAIQINYYIANENLAEVEALFAIIQKKRLEADEELYNTIINAFCTHGQFEKAQKAFQLMKKREVEPTGPLSYTVLLQTAIAQSKFAEADLYFWQMKNAGFSPPESCFVALIEQSGKDNIEKAESYFGAYLLAERYETDSVFGAMIDVYIAYKRVRQARSVMQKAKELDVTITQGIYCSLMQGYLERNEIKVQLEIFKTMKAAGILPNDKAYSLAITGLYTSGDYEGARSQLVESKLRLLQTVDGYLDCHTLEPVVAYLDLENHLQNLSEGKSLQVLTRKNLHGEPHQVYAMRDFIVAEIGKKFPQLSVLKNRYCLERLLIRIKTKPVVVPIKQAEVDSRQCAIC